jgi:hypothetical protein
MPEMKKITAFVPADILEYAQAYTGEGVSETLRVALRELAHKRACEELLALRGKVKLDIDLAELRQDREFDDRGNVL